MYSRADRHSLPALIQKKRPKPAVRRDKAWSSDTLVIHPDDPSTAFLGAIYQGKNWRVVTDQWISRDEIEALIAAHRRVVLLGHGTELGLSGGWGYLVDADLAPALKSVETVCIWCHADVFVRQHGLKGLFSGMFISEVIEAELYGITDTDEERIQWSNELFARALGRHIDGPDTLQRLKDEYVCPGDAVVAFNHERLHCTSERGEAEELR